MTDGTPPAREAVAALARGLTLLKVISQAEEPLGKRALADASVYVGLRDGVDMLMIESVRPRAAVILSGTDVSTRINIATSASGRACLAALDVADRRSLLADLRAAGPEGCVARLTTLAPCFATFLTRIACRTA